MTRKDLVLLESVPKVMSRNFSRRQRPFKVDVFPLAGKAEVSSKIRYSYSAALSEQPLLQKYQRRPRSPSNMATTPKHLRQLAQALPPRLLRFFARYPPQAIVPQSQLQAASTQSSSEPLSTLPSDSTASQIPQGQDGLTVPSPFRSQKHPVTGKWHDPVFSLRRQADLVKLARQHGVEGLLPLSVKSTEYRLQRRMENGLRVKGTGIGQRVKGKESERTMKGRYVLLSFCGCFCRVLSMCGLGRAFLGMIFEEFFGE